MPSMLSPDAYSSDPSSRRKRVTAEHTLNRVRENQRRHRARRKDYIETLEKKLADTEQQLDEARKEIAALRAQRESSQWNWGLVVPDNVVASNAQPPGGIEGELEEVVDSQAQEIAEPVEDTGPGSLPTPTISPTSTDLAIFNALGDPTSSKVLSLELLADVPILPGPPPCCIEDPAIPALNETVDVDDPECRSCKTRPPPSPSESTTLCSQAYVLIAQQNFRAIDARTIRTWLFQGFRRAQRAGEGCRVENTALMSLLDFISGCEEMVGVPCGHQGASGAAAHDSLFF